MTYRKPAVVLTRSQTTTGTHVRVPTGPVPKDYWPVPDLTVEIRSPSDRPKEIDFKVAEYLDAGVLCVLVVDPATQQVHVHAPDHPVRILEANQTLILDTGLPGFLINVSRFFN